jgi:hypothetical protein
MATFLKFLFFIAGRADFNERLAIAPEFAYNDYNETLPSARAGNTEAP